MLAGVMRTGVMRTGVMDPGCLLVWVVATAADGWRSHGQGHGKGSDGHGASGSTSGLEGARVGGGGEATSRGHTVVADRVHWEFLKEGLMDHLSGKLMVPSSLQLGVGKGSEGAESPYDFTAKNSEAGEDEEEGHGGESEVGWTEAREEWESWHRRVGSRQERILNDRELCFIRGVLKQGTRLHNRHRPGVVAGRTGAKNGGGINGDVIYVEEFAAFSRWWAPLMQTLSFVKRDWEASDPVRVHGFVGRFWADRELKRSRPGTFLLRFSESELGMLVISFREREHVSRSLLGEPMYIHIST